MAHPPGRVNTGISVSGRSWGRMIVELHQTDGANRANAIIATGQGLTPLPPGVWESWEIRDAATQGHPGAVIAAVRKAHGLNQGQLGALAGFSQSAISRIESGGNLAFDMRMLRIFQRLLGIPPHLLGLAHDTFPIGGQDSVRLVAPISPAAARDPFTEAAVDTHTFAAACTSMVLAALPVDSFGSLVERAPIDPDVVRRLLDVAALYAEFTGWLHQEVGDLASAANWTQRALQQAQAADDPGLVAYVYLRMGQLAEVDGDGDRMVGLARAAQREQGLSTALRALALQEEARAHAVVGDTHSGMTVLDEASLLAEEVRSQWTDEYRVGYYITEHSLRAQRSACLLELGRSRDAIEYYQSTRAGQATLCQWEQGLHLAKLARALAENGDLDQAAAIGYEALSIGRKTGAVVVTNELRRLDAWRHAPVIADLTNGLPQA